jgi:aryl-alcohol dehydrogenase-like predicted oxidoreductase
MRTRRFGRTGLKVSELTFGGGWVGGILIHQDDDVKRRAIARALEGGINWIDTAPSYGDGRSETAIGWLLAELPAERRPHVSTKVRLDIDRLDDAAGEVERSLHESLKRLRLERVDLLQLHNPLARVTGDGRIGLDRLLGRNGVLDALEAMQAQGLCRFLGCTAAGEAEACVAAIESGRLDTAQVYYNLICPTAATGSPPGWSGPRLDGILAACRARDVGVMVIRALAAGVLASEQRHGREVPMFQAAADLETEAARAAAVFAVLGDRHGTRAQAALRFVLANPEVSTVVVGLAELAHLDEAMQAAEAGPLPADALAALEPVYRSDFGRLST